MRPVSVAGSLTALGEDPRKVRSASFQSSRSLSLSLGAGSSHKSCSRSACCVSVGGLRVIIAKHSDIPFYRWSWPSSESSRFARRRRSRPRLARRPSNRRRSSPRSRRPPRRRPSRARWSSISHTVVVLCVFLCLCLCMFVMSRGVLFNAATMLILLSYFENALHVVVANAS